MTSLTLGNLTFPSNIIQGPLAGVSSAPFRKLIWRYSRPAFTCTEMISCKTLLYQADDFLKRFIYKDPEDGPLCFQLSGCDPVELAAATVKATTAGADLIDLNCGCPVKKIRTRGAGSRLLSQPSLIYQLINAMKKNTHVPVSIKIRVDGHSGDGFNRDIAKAVSDAGADYLIVHGRHWSEQYETPCRYDEITFFVNEMTIPVIGNGDVACTDSLQQMLATGCAGAMIARASVGQPWLLQSMRAAISGDVFQRPTVASIGRIFIEHVQGLVQLLGNEKFALLESRKLAKYYARDIGQKSEFCAALQQCTTWLAFEAICAEYFQL